MHCRQVSAWISIFLYVHTRIGITRKELLMCSYHLRKVSTFTPEWCPYIYIQHTRISITRKNPFLCAYTLEKGFRSHLHSNTLLYTYTYTYQYHVKIGNWLDEWRGVLKLVRRCCCCSCGVLLPMIASGNTHCNALQHTAMHCNALQRTAIFETRSLLQLWRLRTATYCNILQHTATHIWYYVLYVLFVVCNSKDTFCVKQPHNTHG